MNSPQPGEEREFEATLGDIRTRAQHPEGYRLYDYRPDVLVLLGAIDAVLTEHAAVPAQVGGPADQCSSCETPLAECHTRAVLARALRFGAERRRDATRPRGEPAAPPGEEGS